MRFRVKTITTHAISHLLILPKPVGDLLKTNEILKQSIAILIGSFRSIEIRIKVNRFQRFQTVELMLVVDFCQVDDVLDIFLDLS